MCASTALVGSTSTSVVGVGEQRPGQREPLPLAAGERPAALLDLAVEAVGQRVEHVVGRWRPRARLEDRRVVAVAPRVELVAQRAGEQARLGLADTTIRRARRPAAGRRADVRRARTPAPSAPKRPSRSASAADSSGRADTTAVSWPGSTLTPLSGSTSVAPSGRRRPGASGVLDVVRLDRAAPR